MGELFTAWGMDSIGGIVLACVLALVFLYAGRNPVHSALRGLGRVFHTGLRLASRSVMSAEQRLRERNRQVVLHAGREAQERLLEREFQRIHAMVQRDLSGYPALNRTLSEQLIRIEEDYRQSTEVPPQPPEWLAAVEAVAKIPSADTGAVAEILQSIRDTLLRAQKDSMTEYRKSCRTRHGLLKRMLPYWRRLSTTMSAVERKMADLDARIPAIDRQMQLFADIIAQTPRAERELTSSFATQFVVAGVVLTIAVLGGFINFHLIALPMSEMVGGSSYLGPLKTADVAALVIILVEMAMGIFLMESLRITRMFPAIHAMDDQMRRRMIMVTCVILAALAGVESALAYMRDLLAADREALTRTLTGEVAVESSFRWIASIGQMILGFVLPFALACVAIPLESFIYSARVVIGNLIGVMLRVVALGLRLLASAAWYLSRFAAQIYDVVIFLPLSIERALRQRRELARLEMAAPTLRDVVDRPLNFNLEPAPVNTFVTPNPAASDDSVAWGPDDWDANDTTPFKSNGRKPDVKFPDGSGSPVFP